MPAFGHVAFEGGDPGRAPRQGVDVLARGDALGAVDGQGMAEAEQQPI